MFHTNFAAVIITCLLCGAAAGDAHWTDPCRDISRWTIKSVACGESFLKGSPKTSRTRLYKCCFFLRFEHLTVSLRVIPPLLLLFQTVFLSVFMFQLLRTVGLRAFSMASETYSSGTHSAAFVTCPNDTVAKELAR